MKGKKVAVKIVTVQLLAVSHSLEDDDRSIDSNPQQSPYGGRQSQQCGVWKDLFSDIICTSRSPLIDTQNIGVRPTLRLSRRESSAEAPANTWAACVQKNSSKTNFFLSSISQLFKHLEWNPPSGHYNCGHLNTQQNYTEKSRLKCVFFGTADSLLFSSFRRTPDIDFPLGSPPTTTTSCPRQLTTGL